ncbi:pectinesterase-like [Pistacia vera]|uniref:pectinesterase-like n=1 Tax=Pistacia vera TaxID=55513 RepID=UPI00126390E6|nr:pectinesterase-like [Pistacia vera]
MASKSSNLHTLFLFLILFISPSLSSWLPSSSSSSFSHSSSFSYSDSSESICNKFTPYPDLCKSTLNHKTGTIFDFGRIFMHQSLSQSKKVLSFVEYFLNLPSTSYSTNRRALEDCRLLASLNIDFLTYTSQFIDSSDILDGLQAEDSQTLLSATLTNHQSCLESLHEIASASTVKNALLPSLVDGAKFYSISLALFSHGWVHSSILKGRWLAERKHIFKNDMKDGLPLRMSVRDQEIYESVSGRKLSQSDENRVVVNKTVVVSKYGYGDFVTINDAVAAAPNNTKRSYGYYLIYVVAGVYEECVSIAKNKKYVMMIGDGINQTVITGNKSVIDGWTTFNSATFAVVGQGFVAVNITFKNTAGAIKHQAVAVRNGADMSTFYSCSFEGYQDTLYTNSLRQFYRDCDIYGTVDFIFGNAAVVFQNCNLYPRRPLENQFNAITAQGRTDPNQNTGISIHNCTIMPAGDLVSGNYSVKTYLGRPWKQYSRTVYMQSFIGSLIHPVGWKEWSGDYALNTSYYAEYNNTGPGSNTTGRVTWAGYHVINKTETARNFTVSKFIHGKSWLPATVPFEAGLLHNEWHY